MIGAQGAHYIGLIDTEWNVWMNGKSPIWIHFKIYVHCLKVNTIGLIFAGENPVEQQLGWLSLADLG